MILGIIGLTLLIFVAYFIDYYNKLKKSYKELLSEHNANFMCSVPHFQGLPIAENTLCQLFSCDTEYKIIANGNSFRLHKNKITDVSINSDVDIQKHYNSSIGGAVGGAILFGPIGAAIGGRTKEKTSTVITNYLIFTYKNDNEIKYVAFDCTNNPNANKFIQEFNKNKPNTINEIQL